MNFPRFTDIIERDIYAEHEREIERAEHEQEIRNDDERRPMTATARERAALDWLLLLEELNGAERAVTVDCGEIMQRIVSGILERSPV